MILFRRTATLAAITVLCACSSASPTAPNGFLTGSWSFVGASVEDLTFTLSSSGGTVTGTVVDAWQPSPTPVRGTVTGTYGGGQFTLYLRFPSGTQRWFGDQDRVTGYVVNSSSGDNELQTQWHQTAPNDSTLGSLVFFRVPVGDP